MKNSDILVVIPTLNERTHIEGCIRSLFASVGNDIAVDIVVADGGSGDGTQAVVENMRAEFPTLSLLHNPLKIQSGAVNLAVRRHANSHHKILIRCDAHASYPKDFIPALVKTMRDTGAQSVVIPMDSKGENAFAKVAAWIVDTHIGAGGSAHRGGTKSGFVDHGHHAAFDLEWFQRTGGYDQTFSHNEDAEFDYRLVSLGGRIWLESSIRIDYFMRPSLLSLSRQYWNYGYGRAKTVCKHRMPLKIRQAVPIINFLAIIILSCLSFLYSGFLVWPLSYIAALVAVSVYSAVSTKKFSGLWAGPALFSIHNYWAAGFLSGIIVNYRTSNIIRSGQAKIQRATYPNYTENRDEL